MTQWETPLRRSKALFLVVLGASCVIMMHKIHPNTDVFSVSKHCTLQSKKQVQRIYEMSLIHVFNILTPVISPLPPSFVQSEPNALLININPLQPQFKHCFFSYLLSIQDLQSLSESGEREDSHNKMIAITCILPILQKSHKLFTTLLSE